jgi:hypothetical protein
MLHLNYTYNPSNKIRMENVRYMGIRIPIISHKYFRKFMRQVHQGLLDLITYVSLIKYL